MMPATVLPMERALIESDNPDEDPLCMFCQQPIPNRGEAYYDHLQANEACHGAWEEWQERLDEDRKSGG